MTSTSRQDATHDASKMTPDKTDVKSTLVSALKTGLKVGFAVGLIYWMIHKGALDLDAFAKLATPGLIAICLGSVFMQIFLNNYRWLLLLRGHGITSTVRYTLPLTFIGMFFNFVMPGGVGGDVIKGYYLLQDHPHQKFAGAVSIFMDRMIGFFVMIACAFLALFFNWNSVAHSRELQSVAVGVVLLFCGFIVFFSVAFSRRLGHRIFSTWVGHFIFETLPGGAQIRKIYDVIHSYRNHLRIFWQTIALSIVNQFFLVSFFYAIGQAMGVHEVPLAVYFFLVPIGIVVTALPISPAGLGVGQAAFYFLFSLYLGKSSQLGPTAVTVMQVTNFIWGLLGAVFYLRRPKRASNPAAPAVA
jgi:uncharacterized protein (TIRG00374 family)